jgi:rubrerythrin
MSIVESLRKLVDPVEARAREEELRVTREQPKRDDAAPPLFVCRVCGHRSADGSYCPVCLADTMERVAVRGAPPPVSG